MSEQEFQKDADVFMAVDSPEDWFEGTDIFDIEQVVAGTQDHIAALRERVRLADSLIDVSWKLFLDGMKYDHEGMPDPPLQGDDADYFEIFAEYENKYRMPELEAGLSTGEPEEEKE